MESRKQLTLFLPWPPSVNTYWRHVLLKKSVRTMISAKGRNYRRSCTAEVLRQGAVLTRLTGRLSVYVYVNPPDRRKRDLDNLPKGLLDALTRAEVWGDDSQIDDLQIVRGPIIKGGGVTVRIKQLTQAQ